MNKLHVFVIMLYDLKLDYFADNATGSIYISWGRISFRCNRT